MRRMILGVVAVLALGACAPAPSLVGNWKLEKPMQVKQGPVTLDVGEADVSFTGDKKFTMVMKAGVMGQTITLEQSGTYSIAEQQVTMTITEMKANGQAVDVNNPAIKSQLSSTSAFEFEGSNKVKMTLSGSSTTLVRK